MAVTVLKDVDTAWLDQTILRNGLVWPVKWKRIRSVTQNDILVWCTRNGIYQLPVRELIDWLKQRINGRSAIEICAGRSCLGRHLNIPMSDSFMHLDPQANVYYQLFQQAPTIPDADVEKLTSNEAVIKYRPQVVVGAWVTQIGDGADGQSNVRGTDEEAILDLGCTYIHIGNLDVHGGKRILKRPHEVFHFPWLLGRGFDRSQNRIWVWGE